MYTLHMITCFPYEKILQTYIFTQIEISI